MQPDKDVRQQAAVALGQVPHAELADELAELLWSEPDFFVRETLTWVLVRTPQESAAAAVSALTSSRSPDSTRLQALHLLSKIADPIAVDAASAVAGLLDHENPLVADKARWTLARIGGPEAVPALVAQLGEADAAARDSLTTALAQLGASAVGPLVGSLSAADPLVRSHAADVLCFIGAAAEAASAALAAALSDTDERVRMGAAMALLELSGAGVAHARAALARAAEVNPDGRVRAVARRALSSSSPE